MSTPRRSLTLPTSATDAGNCSTCGLCEWTGKVFTCLRPEAAVAGSPVETWRASTADLDAEGWPTPASASLPRCPGHEPVWSDS